MSPSEKENSKEDLAGNGSHPVTSKKQKLLDFEDSIRISDKTAINRVDEVIIDITDATHNPGGLFSFSYNEFTIETQPFGWNVTRREQDFKRFRDYMLKKFPQFVIPPLFQTKLLGAQADIATKRIYYEEFLREIASNKELCACKYLEEFLSINDYDGFREVRRLREKEPAVNSLTTYSNLNGRAKLTIQCQNPKVLHTYNTFFIDRYEQIMRDINNHVSTIKVKSDELATSITNFGNSIDALSDLFSDCGFEDHLGLYNDIKCISTAYEEATRSQANIIKEQLDFTINFHLLETNSFREFHKHKEDVYWEFYKLGKDLQSKKDRLWDDREKKETHAKWLLHSDDAKNLDTLLQNEFEAKARMLPKETQVSWDKNNQFKHLQRRSVEEIQRLNDVLGKKIKQKFINISKEQLNIINR